MDEEANERMNRGMKKGMNGETKIQIMNWSNERWMKNNEQWTKVELRMNEKWRNGGKRIGKEWRTNGRKWMNK